MSRLGLISAGAILSSLCMIVGWNWDISWHRSIGRDTTWTLPHISIYLALALAFGYNAWLVLSHTFGRDRDRPSIRVLGFRGPSGAFVTLCGILIQFVAVLFDDWWHGAYGLDIGVFSPPHALLGSGIHLFYLGQFLLVVLYRNLALPSHERLTRWVLVCLWALFLGHAALTFDPSYGHMGVRSHSFVTSSATLALTLVLIHRYLEWPWAGTVTAAIYMLSIIVLMQIFQLFPATPKFGPVYYRIESFLPPLFPLLLVIPAFLLDTILVERRGKGRWVTAGLLGVAFVAVFNVTNWLSSEFMTSPLADNRIFGGGYPGSAFEATFRQAPLLGLDLASLVSLLVATAIAGVSSLVGLAVGKWLQGLVR